MGRLTISLGVIGFIIVSSCEISIKKKHARGPSRWNSVEIVPKKTSLQCTSIVLEEPTPEGDIGRIVLTPPTQQIRFEVGSLKSNSDRTYRDGQQNQRLRSGATKPIDLGPAC